MVIVLRMRRLGIMRKVIIDVDVWFLFVIYPFVIRDKKGEWW
jgi:hypothetical protein